MPTPTVTPSSSLTVEAIVAVESAREFRLHPRDRIVAYTAEAAGTRQLFTLGLRGGYPVQVTASDKPVSEPQWSPDGRRLTFVRDDEIWVVEADGSRLVRVVVATRSRSRAALVARRTSDRVPVAAAWLEPGLGDRCAGAASRSPGQRAETCPPDGRDGPRHRCRRLRVVARRCADGGDEPRRGRRPRCRPDLDRRGRHEEADASLPARPRTMSVRAGCRTARSLYLSDADGWFQVIRLTADGHDRIVLTAGEREHGEPGGGVGYVPLPSPEGRAIRPHRGPRRCPGPRSSASSTVSAPPKRGRGPATEDTPDGQRRDGRQHASTRGTASGDRSAGCRDGSWVVAVGERETAPQDLWLLPVPGVAP